MEKRGRPRGGGKTPKKFKDRFQKFYYEHRDRLNAQRRAQYRERKKHGLCIRCGEPSLTKLFCKDHYTAKAYRLTMISD